MTADRIILLFLCTFILSCSKVDNVVSAEEWTQIVRNSVDNFDSIIGNRVIEVSLEDDDGYNFVNIACVRGNYAALKYLFTNYDISPDVLNSKSDAFGTTPLHGATSAGSIDCVTFLLENNADPNIKDTFGLLAIDWARKMNKQEILELFQEKSVSDDASNQLNLKY